MIRQFHLDVPGKRTLFIISATLFALMLLLSTSVSLAHGVADQVNDPADATSGWNCGLDLPGGFGPSLFQSFTPNADNLTAAELRLRVTGELPAEGLTPTIWIREGAPDGAVLGTSSAVVGSTGTQLVHFDFTPALTIIPGDTYVIEWSAHVTTMWSMTWIALDTDPYPGGNFFGCFGDPDTNWDFNFITYEEASPPVANDDAASTAHNTAAVIDVAANDTDPDADLVLSSVVISSDPANGSAISNGDGTVTYTPNPGFSGVDTFTYEICDLAGLCDDAQVQVDVANGGGGEGAPGRPDEPGEVVPDNPSNAGDHANENACDNPGSEHRPRNIPPCR